MTAPTPDYEIVSSIAIAFAIEPSVGNPQHDALASDNQNKSSLPEMSDQMILLKY